MGLGGCVGWVGGWLGGWVDWWLGGWVACHGFSVFLHGLQLFVDGCPWFPMVLPCAIFSFQKFFVDHLCCSIDCLRARVLFHYFSLVLCAILLLFPSVGSV